MFLDHDLEGSKTGSDLTKFWFDNVSSLATQKPIVIIHSMNMAGAKNMENFLMRIAERMERIPFVLIAKDKVDICEYLEY